MKKTIEEADVGIFCYISKLPGFRGILKQRYSDFIVNEVDSDGNVVHLISLDAPLQPVEEQVTKVSDQSKKSYSPEIELFRSLVGDTDANCLEAFFYQLSSGVEESMPPIVLSPDSDKSHRKAVHNFFKQNLKFLVTDTVDGPDASSKCIRVRLNSGGFQNRRRNSKKRKDRGDKPFDSRGSDDWPEHVGKFLQFHLYKENKETQEALALIAKMLGIQPRSFGFAGTKDKRSVSSQRVTVFKQHANRLAALNERLIGIKIGDFCHVKEGLLLGQLMGNRFTVTLRGVVADSEDIIKSSADSLGRHGFINYFGLQRFGSGAVPTYLIGAALLRGEWRAAVDMILDPRDGERESVRQAREYYKESDDIGGTLRQLPHYLVAERAILQSLKSCRGNYLQALKAIPRTLRMMYVHSYQSYLWNHAASMRVQKYGTEQVVLGDLVYSKEDLKENVALDSSELDDASYDNASNNGQSDEISEAVELEGKNIPVKVVTAEDLPAGKYTILDVLLPLPGSRVTYPTNDIAEVYHDLAKKDAISLTERAHNIKEFSITNMSGGYRRVFQTPIEFQWELLTYTDGNMPLAETDLDKIYLSKPMNTIRKDSDDGKKEETASFCKEQSESIGNDMESLADVRAPEEGKDAPKIVSDQKTELALKLAFTLPASSYATMAIRELLKTSTSAAFHKSLNG